MAITSDALHLYVHVRVNQLPATAEMEFWEDAVWKLVQYHPRLIVIGGYWDAAQPVTTSLFGTKLAHTHIDP